ncbi:hypothetical protein JB92DRAFT_209989 [Gautieria morchelliformis]|nr:hypothetical protein JB92DRAFT_209989 [Gautieria morchelliformis]
MLYHLLNQVHRFINKVYYSLFMDDRRNRPPVLFNNDTPTPLTIQAAMLHPLLPNEVNVAVVEVQFRKMSSRPYHEFLIFKVEDPHYFHAGIIVVDRYVGEVSDDELWRRAIPADSDDPELTYLTTPPSTYRENTIIDRPPPSVAGQGLLSLSSAAASSSSIAASVAASSAASNAASEQSMAGSMKLASSVIPDKPALDRLTFVNLPIERYVKENRKGSFVCKRFTGGTRRLTVAELLILVHAVHQQNRSYHLLQYQCYWFADVLYNAAMERCGKVDETIRKSAMSPGNFGIVHVIHHRSSTHREVIQRHEEAWVTANQRLEALALVTKQYNQSLQEEREGRRKAEADAENEARARQKAEAAARRADEEIKQLKRQLQISEAIALHRVVNEICMPVFPSLS